MSYNRPNSSPEQRASRLRFLPFLFLILALACSLPGFPRQTPAPEGGTQLPGVGTPAFPAGPTATPQPLPPALIESDPPPGSEIPLASPFTFYFNQPMDRASVEGALSGQPTLSGSFSWRDDSTLTFQTDAPFLPDTQVAISIAASARSLNGLALLNPLTLNFQTAGYLQLTQGLPDPDAFDVSPSAAVMATFNRPVVALGAEQSGLPAALRVVAPTGEAARGRGVWVNTSTYVFYPEPPLAGGTTYAVQIERGLTGVEGSSLAQESESMPAPYEWSFTTSTPRWVSATVDGQLAEDGMIVGLNPKVELVFNQPMDATSVEENLFLLDVDSQPVPGNLQWNEDLTSLTFTPVGLLGRNSLYRLELGAQARSGGGTSLEAGFQARLYTVSTLSVGASDPSEGDLQAVYEPLTLYFTTQLPWEEIHQYLSISPEVPNLFDYLDVDQRTLRISADFAPETDYTLTVSAGLTDLWGDTLDAPFVLNFRTGPLDPNLVVRQTAEFLFLTPQAGSLPVEVTNLSSVPFTVGSVPLNDFITMLGVGGYDFRQSYLPADARSVDQPVEVAPNRSQAVDLQLAQGNAGLAPGIYHLKFNLHSDRIYNGPFLIVASNVQLTFKMSATDALVWAVDLRDNTPVAGASVAIYDENNSPLALGQTDAQGVFYTSIPTVSDPYRVFSAVLGRPGEEQFGFALSTLSQGIDAWNFGIRADYTAPGLMVYLYTDRPIYRPGQTVYYRAVVRQAYNGRYTLPDASSLPGSRITLKMYNDIGEELITYDLPLSAFGTAHGEFTLPSDARPGYYRLGTDREEVSFQVADYRKPTINLQVSFDSEQSLAGEALRATVNARYFFDAPASDVPVLWSLYRTPSYFYLPDYQVGPVTTEWLTTAPGFFFSPFGEPVDNGEGRTGPDGLLNLQFNTEASQGRMGYTLEVTAQDESEQPVSARASAEVNPASFFIGVRPDVWVGEAGKPVGFGIFVVDWDQKPAGAQTLHAEFQKVVWVREDPKSGDPFASPIFKPVYSTVASTDFHTGEDGMARLEFTPPEAGTFQLSVSGADPNSQVRTLTQALVWVGGPGHVVWPDLPNQKLQLSADRTGYRPGDTARVFVPNQLGEAAQVLVTVERGMVLRYETHTVGGSGITLSLPLSDEDVPNVYLSVTVIGRGSQGQPDFRQGYLNIPVEPVQQTLQVTLTSQPERVGPGERVAFDVRVTDSSGTPVQGEFSFAVVDLAALALADPNAPDILPAFYGEQPLGVRTGVDLAAYALRRSFVTEGLGGGGGEAILPVVRERFPDTAYWNAELLTDANGEARIELPLPDSLTTWKVDVRGLTADTRVGEASTQVITTKELQVRPVMPRFLVAGDHLPLAALVHNNTTGDLLAEVSLAVQGILLDEGDPAAATRQVNVPAGGRARVEWWGTAQDVDFAEVVFSVAAGGLRDSVRVTGGDGGEGLPVLRYSAPQTFATSGLLSDEGNILEAVSLPRGAVGAGRAAQGELRLVLSPSLASVSLGALASLDAFPYESTEQLLSRYLANLEVYRALASFGIESPDLQARLQGDLSQTLERLLSRQKQDGGWPWWPSVEAESDPYVTAYVLFGLSRAREAGANVTPEVIQRAGDYLFATLPAPQMVDETWQLDRLAFEHFVLAQVDRGDLGSVGALYEARDRLNPWARALLAYTLNLLDPGGSGADQARSLISDLQTAALRSATGAHWDDTQPDRQNFSTPVFATSVVVFMLGQLEPASSLLPEAARYLVSARQPKGGWDTSYETAWAVLALTQFMKGTGELGGNFGFRASMNGVPLAEGRAAPGEVVSPVTAQVPAANLYPGDPNALLIQREAGLGVLYYSAYLDAFLPVEGAQPVNRGYSVSRLYYPAGDPRFLQEREPVGSARVGDMLAVRLTLTLPEDAYYLVVEDYIPAGTEVLNTSLKTSQQGLDLEPGPLFDPSSPLSEGWGWWRFHPPLIYDDHIAWSADYLPAGTYELTYTLVMLQPGEYRVIPARAWEFYFPEVQGLTGGMVFEVKPEE